MKSILKLKKVTTFLVIVFVTTLFLSSTVNAYSYYNGYKSSGNITNNDYPTTQGFAVGSTYAYSAKINDDESRAVIYRTNMNTGETIKLKNSKNGKDYTECLGHANDMTVCSLDSKSHLFVTTMKASSNNLVKIKIDGKKYSKVGAFSFKLDGKPKSISGINIMTKNDEQITFLCKSGKTFYTGSIKTNANSGTINLKKIFTINIADSLVKGKKVSNLDSFTGQGIGYSSGNLYVPLWGGNSNVGKPNVSIVLVYRNVSASSKGTLKSDPDLSFRITSSTYETFEIEGCGIRKGVLWFNSNRNRASNESEIDGVHYFNNYIQ